MVNRPLFRTSCSTAVFRCECCRVVPFVCLPLRPGEAMDGREDWPAMLGRMIASPRTLCKHNISNFAVVGVVAACAGPAHLTPVVVKTLWQVCAWLRL